MYLTPHTAEYFSGWVTCIVESSAHVSSAGQVSHRTGLRWRPMPSGRQISSKRLVVMGVRTDALGILLDPLQEFLIVCHLSIVQVVAFSVLSTDFFGNVVNFSQCHVQQFEGWYTVEFKSGDLIIATGIASAVRECQAGRLPVLSLFTGIAGLELGLAAPGAELWSSVPTFKC